VPINILDKLYANVANACSQYVEFVEQTVCGNVDTNQLLSKRDNDNLLKCLSAVTAYEVIFVILQK